jgi:hypothetical protein
LCFQVKEVVANHDREDKQSSLSSSEIKREISRAESAVEAVSLRAPSLVRPVEPY